MKNSTKKSLVDFADAARRCIELWLNEHENIAEYLSDSAIERYLEIKVQMMLALKVFEKNRPTLTELAWVIHLEHIGGNLMTDYAPVFGWHETIVNEISQGGLENFFGAEEVQSYALQYGY